ARFQVPAGWASSPVVLPARLQGVPVLVVDDNATNRRLLREQLGHWKFQVTAVESVPEAMQALEKALADSTPFALAILDAHMPLADGFVLAERIKQHPKLSGTALIMLTSSDRPEDTARCRELGIPVYMRKPVKQSELLLGIGKALRVSGLLPPDP